MEGWLDGEAEVYRFVTRPDLDKFVPKRLQRHFKGGGLQYTDIIRYHPDKIAQSPFVLDVTSIPPILAERVRCLQRFHRLPVMSGHAMRSVGLGEAVHSAQCRFVFISRIARLMPRPNVCRGALQCQQRARI